jgi:integrating conjugative element protein (TIGR03752 family)
MQLKSNRLLHVLVPLLLLGAGFIGLKSCTGNSHTANKPEHSDTVADLDKEELKALGIDGDTPEDTVATLVGQMKQYREEMAQIKKDSATLIAENQQLRQRDNSVEKRINSAISHERENFSNQLQQQQTSLLDNIQKKLDQLTKKPASGGSDIPVGLGLEGEGSPDGALHWIEPADAVTVDPRNRHGNNIQFPRRFGRAESATTDIKIASRDRQQNDATPVYTVPENSTLIGSVAMTALLGRVPINGTVSDPYPFKILIGHDNLIANGVELPEVESAVMSGTASGDWTLSCVRGQITSITFIFQDGTVRTLPQQSGNSENSNGSGDGGKSQHGDIGWLSDPQGLPCIPGERKSNAGEYLSSQFLLAGSSAAAEAFANGETTTTVEGGDITSAVTGSNGQYVLGQALGGGLKESADWFKQRYGQMFDAIYVKPGQPVAVHITRQLQIDYEPHGRKVKYPSHSSRTGEPD